MAKSEYPKKVHVGYKDHGNTEVFKEVNSPEEEALALGLPVPEAKKEKK